MMGGIFKSTEPAQFSFTVPEQQYIATLGSYIANSQDQDDTHWFWSLIDPNGGTVDFGAISALPQNGVSKQGFGQIALLSVAPSVYGGRPGLWTMILQNTNAPTNFALTSDSSQWGGTIDLLAQGATDSTLSRKYIGNRQVGDAGAGTETIYDDNGTSVLGVRAIANGDASPIKPAQILTVGKIL